MAGARRRRLSRSAEFDRVYREGRSHAGRHLVLYFFPREGDDEPPRLGLSVGRKVGGAVERNKGKRLVKEAFWQSEERLPAGHDFVVVARADAGDLAERAGLAGIKSELDELLEKAGPKQLGTSSSRRSAGISASSRPPCLATASTIRAALSTPCRR